MVVAIIGILASIAITKFNSTLRKSKEGQVKGNLGAIRSAVHAYYADTVTTHPPNLEALTTDGKYLTAIPFTQILGYHEDSRAASNAAGTTGINDSAGWAYNNDSNDSDVGHVYVNCTHTDSSGTFWSRSEH